MAVRQIGDPGVRVPVFFVFFPAWRPPRERRQVTGNFEVTVDGALVHSKMTKGQGKCTDATETQLVIDAIQEAVDK